VHSGKDLPTAPVPGLQVAAFPAQEDPRDALVWPGGTSLDALPPGARIGTGSPRRAALLRAAGRQLQIVPIRGNIDTRLRKLADGDDHSTGHAVWSDSEGTLDVALRDASTRSALVKRRSAAALGVDFLYAPAEHLPGRRYSSRRVTGGIASHGGIPGSRNATAP
jgi:porphobilinogen deaminase